MFSSFWPQRAAIRRPGSTWIAVLSGGIAGLSLPIGILMMGWILELLVSAVSGSIPATLRVGLFSLPTDWLNAGNSAVRAVSGLLILTAVIALVKFIAVTLNEIAASRASIDFDTQVQSLLFRKSASLATVDGLSVQRFALQEIQRDHLPKVREAIAAWYTAWPRYALRMVLLVALAVCIHPYLAGAAFMGLLLLRTIGTFIDTAAGKIHADHVERSSSSREHLMYLCDTSPLLATIHSSTDMAHEFQNHLQNYRSSNLQLIDFSGWKSPTFRLISVILTLVFAMLVTIRVLDRSSSIGFGGAAALCASVVLAAYSISKGSVMIAKRRNAQVPLQQIVNYLSQDESSTDRSDLIELTGIRRELVFDHLMLRETNGRKLLEDISVVLKPGQLTAVVGHERFQNLAMVELCLGFGKPTSGRMLIDGIDSNDVSRAALQRLALWIAPNGPLFSGSIEENLWGNGQPDAMVDLMDSARKARVADAIMNLPEGMQTLVSPSGAILPPDALFRIGIARGFVKKPSIVVAEEPTSMQNNSSQNTTHADTTDALVQLRNEGLIVVVLPSRISTLRAADQIVLLNDHRVEDIGTHAELLERNERYRHMNYVRFARFGIG